VVKDKDGNVVSDSRKQRITKKQELAERVAKHRSQDPVLASIAASYQSAVTDPDNELVHLYEILDALKTKFGGKDAALASLNIEKESWNKLGQLANHTPLRQGRHRGSKIGELRNATKTELEEVRHAARTMVEAYLDYLEQNTG
jgi:hypothetical protein